MENNMLKPNEICNAAVGAGCSKAALKTYQQAVLGILAGAFIACGGVVSAVASHGITNVGVSKFVGGAVFPVGLILVVICGAELFTGNCLMVVPLVGKEVTLKPMIKNWIVVYIFNFIGSVIVAFLVFESGTFGMSSGKLGGTVIKVASTKASLSFGTAFCSGIMCNFLVCLAVWGAFAAKDIISKIVIIWFPIMTFVTCGFEHSVANMYFLTAGLFAKSNPSFVAASGISQDKIVSAAGIVHNLIPVTLGNIVGGSIFVGLAYFVVYKYKSSKPKESVCK
ncbi:MULTISPECIES: formate/nitrite transporter family protein [Clostridium]|uniref:Formate transporter 1 n=2 Tax=Clostridium TaxID=1485 RepID=D8GTW2_CLOLD|nr:MULTISPECIES: formate/nitrite transporter family protein [Clostridium]ADK16775.1 predicted formate/nitrite transporter [Clostridium ljungdahlii DSM 13528]OAA85685.1 putative formate transporter 1 [Clostridium ljungdahlii DSM 13528]OAA93469.1 putative formate transporter 1 [Clostridium coskatii]OBR96258.1 putative formate transporter 1 [Clostridium coskatii]